MPSNADFEFVDKVLRQVAERFDSVLIAVSVNEEGFTSSAVRRAGNFYASRGLVAEWLERQQNEELCKEFKTHKDSE